MIWCLRITLSCVILQGVLSSLQNLTFFGAYVVFKPDTKYFKFDLNEQIDVLLLEHRTNKLNTKLKDTGYLYRIFLKLINSTTIDCVIQRKQDIKIQSQYTFWNESEKLNMAIRWGSEPRIIDVLTQLDGNHNSILSWKDRSKTRGQVKYVGLAVAPTSIESNSNETDYPYTNWKIREEQPEDVDIRDAFQICDIQFLSDSATNKSSPTVLYKISVTREHDEDFQITVEKKTEVVLRTKTTRINEEKIVVSWDAQENIISFGQAGESSPLFFWQDTEADKGDFNRIEKLSFYFNTRKKNRLHTHNISDGFKTIPELYPKYFNQMVTATATATVTTMKTMQSTTGASSVNETLPPSPSGSTTTTSRRIDINSDETNEYIPEGNF